METAKLTVDQLTKLAQADKQKADRAKAKLTNVRKSAEELFQAAGAVAEISKKNPEV